MVALIALNQEIIKNPPARLLRPRIFDVMTSITIARVIVNILYSFFVVKWFGEIFDRLTVVKSAEKLGKVMRYAFESCYFRLVAPSIEFFDSFQ